MKEIENRTNAEEKRLAETNKEVIGQNKQRENTGIWVSTKNTDDK